MPQKAQLISTISWQATLYVCNLLIRNKKSQKEANTLANLRKLQIKSTSFTRCKACVHHTDKNGRAQKIHGRSLQRGCYWI